MGQMGVLPVFSDRPVDDERTSGADQNALVRAYRAGDRDAAETLVRQTYSLVYASLHRLTRGDVDLAADLSQETYRKAWRSLSSFDGRASFSSWLYRIAYNTFLNHVRRPPPERPLEDAPPAKLNDRCSSPEKALSDAEQSAGLHRAVMSLPDETRFLITARYWGEVPISELAAADNVTTVAIRKRLRRALGEIRAALEKERT